MNRAANNALYALWLSKEVKKILEADTSNTSWALVNKSQLPYQCFLWVEDKNKKSTWHLPYREGTGGIDPDTKMFRRAGPVNLNALRAVSQAIGGARTGTPMNIPAQIKAKIKKLLKQYKIGDYKESKQEEQEMDILESSISGQFIDQKLDKENRLIKGVSLLRPTSTNKYFPGSTGTRFTEAFLTQIANEVNGKKIYADHVSKDELDKHYGIRSVHDLIGYYENGRMENGIPKADIRYLSNQASWIEPLVEEMADKVGLSIAAKGEMIFDRSTGIVEATNLKKLGSIDLVTETGSTINMFESKHDEGAKEMEYEKITMADLIENRPDIIESLTESVKADLSTKTEVDKYKKLNEKILEANKKLKLQVDEFQVKEAARKKAEKITALIKESKIPEEFITDVFTESLMEAKDEERVKKLIEDRKALVETKKVGVHDMGDTTNIHESEMTDEEMKKYAEEIKSAVKEL